MKQWGDRGNKPGEFNTPHSIASDAKGNIYVADLGNWRIQVFDPNGNFIRAMTIDVPFDPAIRPAQGRHAVGRRSRRTKRRAVGDLHNT